MKGDLLAIARDNARVAENLASRHALAFWVRDVRRADPGAVTLVDYNVTESVHHNEFVSGITQRVAYIF